MRSPPGETNGLPESDRTAQANSERQVRSKGTPHVGHTDSITNDKLGSRSDISDWSSSNPVTRVIKVTLSTPLFLYIIIHTSIHAFIPYAHAPRMILPESSRGSGTKASHMRLNASQRSVLRHEAAVASFNMSNDRPGFEGQPTKGLRLPHVKQS